MATRLCFPSQNNSIAVHLAGILCVPSLAIFWKQNSDLTKPKFNKSVFDEIIDLLLQSTTKHG
jgi:hypothetical protein